MMAFVGVEKILVVYLSYLALITNLKQLIVIWEEGFSWEITQIRSACGPV